MVKVLPRDSNKLANVTRHLDYIGRKGELALETDEGERRSGKGVGRSLIEEWDLDLEEHRRKVDLGAADGGRPPKLVHKLMFSMPPGTPAQGVLDAARSFLREQFALKHRYAFVLHTDEPHPHVHAVVKAVSEQGVRLNIRKATLREWRAEFARHLREQGIEANATDRAVRGESHATFRDPIFRAARRGESLHIRARVRALMTRGIGEQPAVESGKAQLLRTRTETIEGWRAVAQLLARDGHGELAADVGMFIQGMKPPRTENEWLARELLESARGKDSRQQTRSR